jgi:hypothetical protein
MTTMLAAREQTRARYPDAEGYVERAGVRVFWERYGEGEPTFLLPPTYEIVHSRSWKCQIPYLSRHGQVVTFDPRGNGRSDRPRDYAAYTRPEVARDAVDVPGRGRRGAGDRGRLVRHGRLAHPGRRAPAAGRRAGPARPGAAGAARAGSDPTPWPP